MSWMERLKNQNVSTSYATKSTKTPREVAKGVSVVFVAPIPKDLEKSKVIANAGNDESECPSTQAVEIPTAQADRWCWPTSPAMNTAEIDTYYRRLDRVWGRSDAERIADRLVIRDRDTDDRVMCVECRHISGKSCQNWKQAEMAPLIPEDMQTTLQRCPGFSGC